MSTTDISILEAKIDSLAAQIKAVADENVKTRRDTNDILYNLDEDNVPMFREVNSSVNTIKSTVSQQGDKISLIVSGDEINAASIVAAINDSESTVTISADHINLAGYVTIQDLSTPGKTTISGDNITTGKISASLISANTEYGGSRFIEFSSPIIVNALGGILSTDGFAIWDGQHVIGQFAYNSDSMSNTGVYVSSSSSLIFSSEGITAFEKTPYVIIDGIYHQVLTTNDTVTAVFG